MDDATAEKPEDAGLDAAPAGEPTEPYAVGVVATEATADALPNLSLGILDRDRGSPTPRAASGCTAGGPSSRLPTTRRRATG